jgi:hypothetical protein
MSNALGRGLLEVSLGLAWLGIGSERLALLV